MKSHCGDNQCMAKYAMFGLGDHNYPRYQAASIVQIVGQADSQLADQMLQKMGATPILELRKGDAAEDLDGDFETWEKDLLAKLQSMYLCFFNKHTTSYALLLSMHDQSLSIPLLLLLMVCNRLQVVPPSS